MRKNFPKIKLVLGKAPFFAIGVPFILLILFVITLAFDMAVLYGNVAFSISVLSTKKLCILQFFLNIFCFPEN